MLKTMNDTRTPIERMIDASCRFVPTKRSSSKIILMCPKCGREKVSFRDKTDPKGTRQVIVKCPKCLAGHLKDAPVPIVYLGKDGKELKA